MGEEIERKFLVKDDSWRDHVIRSSTIVQGYLRAADVAVRVRIEDDSGMLTFKARKPGLTRGEWEYPIPVDDARELIDEFCGDRVVRKVRHYLHVGEHEWTVDEFSGRHAGLLTAEIELDDEEEVFEVPAWLGRDVSGAREYYNEALAEDASGG